MADDHEPFLDIGDLLPRLRKLRDWACESAPAEIYADIFEACVICEALADPTGDWNKSVDVRDVAARLRRQGLHLVHPDDPTL
jgi:hypothetical protein